MRVQCFKCREWFDDLDHSTICPHKYFAMHTVVVRPGKPDVVATSVEQLDRLLKDD